MKARLLYLAGLVVSSIFLTTSCAQTYGYSNRSYDDYGYNTTRNSRVYQRGVSVEAENPDISYNLDLRAVANVFADSRDLEDFEMRINDYQSAINNLDLNRDGQVDYLRVIENKRGNTHLVVLQAVLDYDTYQDVASIAVERRGRSRTYVQIIGDPFLYGPRYIIEPVYVYTPSIFSFFWGPSYYSWHSPYYWGYYPTYYSYWHPMPYRVYANNVNVYIDNSQHTYNYSDNVRSNNYAALHNSVSRNDFARQRPDRSFASRNARANVNNRRDLDAVNRTSARRSSNVNRTRNSSNVNRRGVSSRNSSGIVNRTNRSSNRTQVNDRRRGRTTNSGRTVRSSSTSRSRTGTYNSETRNSSNNRSSRMVRPRSTSNRNSSYSTSRRSTRSNNSTVTPTRRSSRSTSVTPRRSGSSSSRSMSVAPRRSSSSSRSTSVAPRRSSSRSSGISSSRSSSSSRNSSSRSRR